MVSGLLLLPVRETGLLSLYRAMGFSRFFSKVFLRGKRTDQPGSSLVLAVESPGDRASDCSCLPLWGDRGARPAGQELGKSGAQWKPHLREGVGEGESRSAGARAEGGSLLRGP